MMFEPTPPHRSLRILVVDDDADTRMSLVKLLSLWGHNSECVGDGGAALERVGSSFDVVMLDLWLTDMDGCDLAKELRRRNGSKPPYLIAITGCGLDRDYQRTLAAGIDLHLLKPVDPGELLRILDGIN
jgi:CheY-like chemotaxis protein